jgi:hypothetical protein
MDLPFITIALTSKIYDMLKFAYVYLTQAEAAACEWNHCLALEYPEMYISGFLFSTVVRCQNIFPL